MDVQPSRVRVLDEVDCAIAPTEATARVPRRMMNGDNRSWLSGFIAAREARRRGLCPTVETVVDEVAAELRSQCFEPDIVRLTSGVNAGLRQNAVSRDPR
jgi:hypothetical protein